MKMISDELFEKLCSFFLLNENSIEDVKKIQRLLQEKVEAMERHSLYTKYKTSETEDQKEEARKKYLDKVGMLPDWRW